MEKNNPLKRTERQEDEIKGSIGKKKNYRSPHLEVFGDFRRLTKANKGGRATDNHNTKL